MYQGSAASVCRPDGRKKSPDKPSEEHTIYDGYAGKKYPFTLVGLAMLQVIERGNGHLCCGLSPWLKGHGSC